MIRIMLCDDDELFLEHMQTEIRTVVKELGLEAMIESYGAAEEIPQKVMADCDICFLDIDFCEKSYTGIDIAKKMRRVRQDSILIFLTNYIEFAPEGYEVQAFRYALKNEIGRKLRPYLQAAVNQLRTQEEMFQISVSSETITLRLVDVLYLEAQGHNTVIYVQKIGKNTELPKTYRVYSTLSKFEQKLSERGFLRIQKSFLANMRRLKQYRCSGAILDNGTVLPVSEKTYSENKKKFLLWRR